MEYGENMKEYKEILDCVSRRVKVATKLINEERNKPLDTSGKPAAEARATTATFTSSHPISSATPASRSCNLLRAGKYLSLRETQLSVAPVLSSSASGSFEALAILEDRNETMWELLYILVGRLDDESLTSR